MALELAAAGGSVGGGQSDRNLIKLKNKKQPPKLNRQTESTSVFIISPAAAR
jgi:hypothetical protein